MTAVTIDPNAALWNLAFAEYRAARKQRENPPVPRDRAFENAASERCNSAEVALLSLYAPDFRAVAEKLAIVWEFDLPHDSPDTAWKRILLQDVRGLCSRTELA